MGYRERITTCFGGKAFLRPLFYSYPGGLRFELSEGGNVLEQFLRAMEKASEICTDVFGSQPTLTVCLQWWWMGNLVIYRENLREMQAAHFQIPQAREIWLEPVEDGQLLCIAFECPRNTLSTLLWWALASDFSSIRPNPGCKVYLFDFEAELMVFPYDDRGMDVVGPNREHLAELYQKHSRYLLDHDRATMDATFANS